MRKRKFSFGMWSFEVYSVAKTRFKPRWRVRNQFGTVRHPDNSMANFPTIKAAHEYVRYAFAGEGPLA